MTTLSLNQSLSPYYVTVIVMNIKVQRKYRFCLEERPPVIDDRGEEKFAELLSRRKMNT